MSMYGVSKNKGSMSLAGVGSGLSITSPTTGAKIELKEKIIPSSDVWKHVYKSVYNSRSRELMTAATVMGILPSIRASGRNTMPVIAVMDDNGKLEILSGMKRSYAVSISPETNLVVHYAMQMDEEDKQAIAKTADLHEKPSFLDTALSLKKYKDEIGEKFSVRKAAEIFGVGKSSVSDMIKFAELPKELFQMFPGAGYVTWRFLKAISDSNKTDDEIILALRELSPISTEESKILSENAHESLKSECKLMESKILDALFSKKESRTKTFDTGSPFHPSKLIGGIESKAETKGAVSIKMSKEFIASEAGKKLIDLISRH